MDFELNVANAEAAQARLQDRLDAAQPRDLRGLDPQGLVMGLAALIKSISADEADRLRTLDGVLGFAFERVQVLQDCALVLWHTLNARAALQPNKTQHRVAPKTIDAAEALRKRMLRLLAYHLDDSPKVERRLAEIRAGRGHVDTARDLQKLADLYGEFTAAIEGDARRYNANDATEAHRLAAEILGERTDGDADDEIRLNDRQRRINAVLAESHAEVVAAARFALRTSGRAEDFGSLHVLARRG